MFRWLIFAALVTPEILAVPLGGQQPANAISPPAKGCPVPNQIPDTYLVALDTSIDLKSHLSTLQEFIKKNQACATVNNSVDIRFDEPFMKFYSGKFDGRVLGFIGKAKGVKTIEACDIFKEVVLPPPPASKKLSPVTARRSGAPWNLARFTQDGPVSPGKQGTSETSRDWTYFAKDGVNGKNVLVYIIDTGVDATHPEISQRILPVEEAYLLPGMTLPTEAFNQHGMRAESSSNKTAVAGVIAGQTVGVANAVSIFPIKILRQESDYITDVPTYTLDIRYEDVVKGIGNAMKHYRSQQKPAGAVINLSLSLGRRTQVEEAIKLVRYKAHYVSGSIDHGLHRLLVWAYTLLTVRIIHRISALCINTLVAAGNDGENMCKQRIGNFGQIVVGATDIGDKRSTFSNFGSAHLTSSAISPLDGTSFAAPHVTGMIAAIIAAEGNLSPAAMKAKIKQNVVGSVQGSREPIIGLPKNLRTGPLVDV
ncbi:peptidase S8/S53 domain-containing protein [Mycena belliarum]|uniref:Peptidase S8/S53 domain-containing protein n=1 Tax=Mycena belliarum TaxID=1033014 RepID=A0AAD6U889_9AGAR|nr:peptidase S8/S53 domain-containing protein [Mycena belliae]